MVDQGILHGPKPVVQSPIERTQQISDSSAPLISDWSTEGVNISETKAVTVHSRLQLDKWRRGVASSSWCAAPPASSD